MQSSVSSVLGGLAAAAEHPLIDIDFTSFVQFGIFMLALVVATTLIFRPYLAMRDARHSGIEGAREEAARLSAEGEARLADYEGKLDKARVRAQDERRKIRSEAVVAHRELTEKVKAETSAALADTKAKVEREAQTARTDLLSRVDRLGADIASKLLGREVA